MCGDCGCESKNESSLNTDFRVDVVNIAEDIKVKNAAVAKTNKALFDAHSVLVINLMSSPGSGKTRLLEETLKRLKHRYQFAVLEGDLETENDANRIRRHGIHAEQIATGQGCHLDADMVSTAIGNFELGSLDVLFIENVGNLICPACFDLGQHKNVILLSVPEGDDKPEKYPIMFRAADVMLITKTDFLDFVMEFDVSRAIKSFSSVGNNAPVLEVSVKDDERFNGWLAYLTQMIDTHLSNQTRQHR
ncbi:hydrogenase nickel incorporation protein HypB [Alteromonas mediterranea]|uniref:hydrogenase nickel incorporation protein HypB n=1 Tax=Alteromonas mediterranea TaxID=314275 RepID=UPI002FE22BB8